MAEEEGFCRLSEEVAYRRYLTVYDSRVKHPPTDTGPGSVHSYDVVSSRHSRFCVIFPFHPDENGRGGKVTLLREYAQGPHDMVYCLPTGGYDPSKHRSVEDCAAQELAEEARLEGGKFVCLIPPDHPGIPEVKWCANRFTPFLVVDPRVAAAPPQRDREEYIQIRRMDLDTLKVTLLSDQVLPPTTVTCYLAFDKLRELGYL